MRIGLIFILLFTNTYAAKGPKTEYNYKNCLSAREYITTVNYLRDKKEFGLSEKEIQKTAEQVSSGCTEASKNFIKVLKVLSKMGIDTRTAIKYGIEISNKGEDHTKAFISIFKQTYDPQFLDLDVLTSLKLSLKLANNYKTNIKKSLDDFKVLVEFCLENKSMELPLQKCAIISSDVAVIGQDFEKPIAKNFIGVIDFLQNDKKGPGLDRNNSLKTAFKIIKSGELSTKNFKEAYIFATSKKGLKLPTNDAIEFAIKITAQSIKKI